MSPFRRPPDFVIGGAEDPYLLRWHLIPRNRWFNIYLHKFLRSDDDRALHDHPWNNVSILLTGWYWEVVPEFPDQWPRMMKTCHEYRVAGDVICRKAESPHRIALPVDDDGKPQPVWTLFFTGRKRREWGFWCERGWRHWKEFCDPIDTGRHGRGCDE